MFRTKVVKKIKTRILCSVTPPHRKSCRLWDNVGKILYSRTQITISRTHIAWWILKATCTHSEYVMLTAFPLQQWLHERASVLRYMYVACLVGIVTGYAWCCQDPKSTGFEPGIFWRVSSGNTERLHKAGNMVKWHDESVSSIRQVDFAVELCFQDRTGV